MNAISKGLPKNPAALCACAVASLALLLTAAGALADEASPAAGAARVTVDFARSRGPFLHQERHNNFSGPGTFPDQRASLDAELNSRGLGTHIPAFITETGIYPGPSLDHPDPHQDYLIGAAGVPSLHYWFIEQPRTYPLNWVVRHAAKERKDERVAATSDALRQGRDVYAIATRDRTGAAVMVSNYQSAGAAPYRTTIDFGNLPPSLRGNPLRQRMFRIDEKVSNYWADPAHANLQQVAETMVKPGGRQNLAIDLTPNALELIVLEPIK